MQRHRLLLNQHDDGQVQGESEYDCESAPRGEPQIDGDRESTNTVIIAVAV